MPRTLLWGCDFLNNLFLSHSGTSLSLFSLSPHTWSFFFFFNHYFHLYGRNNVISIKHIRL